MGWRRYAASDGYSHACAVYPDGYSHADQNTYTDTNQCAADCHSHTHADADSYPDTDSHSHTYRTRADANSYTDTMPELYMMKKGFTLMELMIVMVLMGILVTLGVASFKSARQKGNDIRRKSNLASIAKALEAYAADHDGYPTDDGYGNIRGCDYGSGFPATCNWGGEWKDDKGTYYMVLLSGDPTAGRKYFYDYDATKGTFQLYALLENTNDVDLQKSGGVLQYYSSTLCSSTLFCNYGVSSTNVNLTTGHTLTASTQ